MELREEKTDDPFAVYGGAMERFPFAIGATSYVWPAGYAYNVKRLLGSFRAIQLLVMENGAEPIPGDDEMAEIMSADSGNVNFCVHLPVDNGMERDDETSAQNIAEIIRRMKPFDPSCFVLHVETADRQERKSAVRNMKTAAALAGVPVDKICVENLNGEFDSIWEGVEESGASICFDAGHLVHQNGDPVRFFEKYGEKIRMGHIHGSNGATDHLPLSVMDRGLLREIAEGFAMLKIEGPVIIENYSVEDVLQSLEALRCIESTFDRIRR